MWGSIMAGNGIWNKAFISLFCVNGLISLSQMMMNVLIALFADELARTPRSWDSP